MTPGQISFSIFRFTLRAEEVAKLPSYLGSVLRGGLGHSLRQISCSKLSDDCAYCLLKSKCPYSQLFENPAMGKNKSHYYNEPHPFIIEPPLAQHEIYQPGQELDFRMVLIGKGVDYLPYLISAFAHMSERGLARQKFRFHLTKVVDVFSPKKHIIYDEETRSINSTFKKRTFSKIKVEAKILNPKQVHLLFLTPTRLKKKTFIVHNDAFIDVPMKAKSHLVLRELDFPLFLMSLLRRLSLLAEIHCNKRWGLDFKKLLDNAQKVRTIYQDLHWYDWERYSSRQNTKLKMGGFVGRVTFEGDLAEFLPFIKMGEYLHIGQGTVFGLGKYIIE